MGREPAEMERVRNMFEWGAGRGGGSLEDSSTCAFAPPGGQPR